MGHLGGFKKSIRHDLHAQLSAFSKNALNLSGVEDGLRLEELRAGGHLLLEFEPPGRRFASGPLPRLYKIGLTAQFRVLHVTAGVEGIYDLRAVRVYVETAFASCGRRTRHGRR
jgi:hypothetical protein